MANQYLFRKYVDGSPVNTFVCESPEQVASWVTALVDTLEADNTGSINEIQITKLPPVDEDE